MSKPPDQASADLADVDTVERITAADPCAAWLHRFPLQHRQRVAQMFAAAVRQGCIHAPDVCIFVSLACKQPAVSNLLTREEREFRWTVMEAIGADHRAARAYAGWLLAFSPLLHKPRRRQRRPGGSRRAA